MGDPLTSDMLDEYALGLAEHFEEQAADLTEITRRALQLGDPIGAAEARGAARAFLSIATGLRSGVIAGHNLNPPE